MPAAYPPGMKSFFRRCCALLCLGALPGLAQLPPPATPPPVAPLPASAFLGWTNAYVLRNDRVEAVLVPAVGRLVHFGPVDGASPLRLDPALQGKIPAADEPFFNVGGDWLWPVAQARWGAMSAGGKDWPPPPPLADLPWTCSAWTDAEGAPCALLARDYGPPVNATVSRLFRLAPDSAALVVRQRIERTGSAGLPVVLWNISQIARAEHIVLPVEKKNRARGGFKVLMGRAPGRRRLQRCGDAVVYRVGPGAETKLGSDSPRGWIAAARGTNLVVESAATAATGEYPDGGSRVEVYSNEGLGYSEIETLSPELDLAPGTILENTLRIELATTPTPLAACPLAATIRALAGP